MTTPQSPFRVQVAAPNPVGQLLVQHLAEKGYEVQLTRARARSNSIAYGAGADPNEVGRLMRELSPFSFSEIARRGPIEGDFDARVRMSLGEPLAQWKIHLHVDGQNLAEDLARRFEAWGFTIANTKFVRHPRGLLRYGGASVHARQVVRWVLGTMGIDMTRESKDWPDEDRDIYVEVQDPALTSLPWVAHFPVVVRSVDAAVADGVVESLRSDGFSIEVQPGSEACERVQIELGPFSSDEESAARIVTAVGRALRSKGVDLESYPLEEVRSGARRVAVVIPRFDRLRPYGGAAPARFRLMIHVPEASIARHLAARAESDGYRAVRVVSDGGGPFGIRIGAEAAYLEAVGDQVRGLVRRYVDQSLDEESCPVVPSDDDNLGNISVWVPRSLDSAAALADARSKHELTMISPSSLPTLRDKATLRGFKSVTARVDHDREPYRVSYGSACPAVIHGLVQWLLDVTGERPDVKREFSSDDEDIYVYVPERLAPHLSTRSSARIAPRLAPASPFAGPAIRTNSGKVWVADMALSARPDARQHVPSAAEFTDFCLSETVVATLRHIATSVMLREPCLLEGDTACSKTSAIRYLGMLLNQSVLRVNMHGAADSADLIGRYVPRGKAWSWLDGVMPVAMREGHWLVLDELNLSDATVLERLNSVLESIPSLVVAEGDGQIIGPQGFSVHDDFRVFATMNPSELEGRNPLSEAFLDRWSGYLRVPFPNERDIAATLEFWNTGRHPEVVVGGRAYEALRVERSQDGPLFPADRIESMARFHVGADRAMVDAAASAGPKGNKARSTRRGLAAAVKCFKLFAELGMDEDAALREMVERHYVGRDPRNESLRSLAVACSLLKD